MRIRLQYILCVLLFLTAGPLCRMLSGQTSVVAADGEHAFTADAGDAFAQTAMPLVANSAGYILSQPVSQDDTAPCRFFNHSLYAPEITGGTSFYGTDLKVLPRILLISGHRDGVRSHAAGGAAREVAARHPRGVDYYVYTLERIRI